MPDRDRTEQDTARRALETHRWWAYRACAPSPADPGMSRTDPTVPLTAWQTPDRETQADRRAREQQATALCHRCPLRQQCAAYALGTQQDGPYERWDIWGGLTAHQRAQLVKDRAQHTTTSPAAPAAAADTAGPLDLEVLRALAAHRSPHQVAATAGLTVTRANWHRARLLTLLHLDPRTTTRMQLLYTARRTGLIDPCTPLLTDRDRIIAALPSRQAAVVRSRGIQLWLPGMHALADQAGRQGPAPVQRPAQRPGGGSGPASPAALHLVPAAPADDVVLAAAA